MEKLLKDSSDGAARFLQTMLCAAAVRAFPLIVFLLVFKTGHNVKRFLWKLPRKRLFMHSE